MDFRNSFKLLRKCHVLKGSGHAPFALLSLIKCTKLKPSNEKYFCQNRTWWQTAMIFTSIKMGSIKSWWHLPNFAQSGASRDTRAQIGCQILQQPSKLGSCNMKALFVSDKEKISIAENSAALMIIQATKLKRTSFPPGEIQIFQQSFL